MTTSGHRIKFGTRGSDLALWQTRHIMALLKQADATLDLEYEIITTRGDQILDTPLPLVGGKGVFTAELEAALYAQRIDCAVHSLKDLPTEPPDALVIGATPQRANPADVLISRRGYTLATLPHGAKVGTSSYRRAAQIRHRRRDIQILDIRGNVDTRIRKALDADGRYDAIVLAYAGLERLGFTDKITEILDVDVMLPAPGQGAIAVQSRDDAALLSALAKIHDRETALAVAAERAFLAGLGGGCSVPVAALAYADHGHVILQGRVSAPDGSKQIDVRTGSPAEDNASAQVLGMLLAEEALSRGARALMEQRE